MSTPIQKSADSLLKSANQKHHLLVLAGKKANKHLEVKKLNWFCRFIRKILPGFIHHAIFKSDPKKIADYINKNPQVLRELRCPWKIDQVANHLKKRQFKTASSQANLKALASKAKLPG